MASPEWADCDRMSTEYDFFSSRRRHTRCLSDWSSDVCSSDLGSIGTIERRGEVLEELRTVSADAGADSIEDMDGQPARIGICLEHEWGHGSNQNRFGNACGAVAADVASQLSTAGGVSNVDRILQIQGLGEGGKIVGIGIHVVAIPWLAGSAVPAAVMADGAESMRGKKDHLIFPRVCAEGPAVTEDDGLTGAPVFVVDGGSVFGCDCGHQSFSLFFALIAAEADRPGLQVDAGAYVIGWHERASRASYPSVMLSRVGQSALPCPTQFGAICRCGPTPSIVAAASLF